MVFGAVAGIFGTAEFAVRFAVVWRDFTGPEVSIAEAVARDGVAVVGGGPLCAAYNS